MAAPVGVEPIGVVVHGSRDVRGAVSKIGDQ